MEIIEPLNKNHFGIISLRCGLEEASKLHRHYAQIQPGFYSESEVITVNLCVGAIIVGTNATSGGFIAQFNYSVKSGEDR